MEKNLCENSEDRQGTYCWRVPRARFLRSPVLKAPICSFEREADLLFQVLRILAKGKSSRGPGTWIRTQFLCPASILRVRVRVDLAERADNSSQKLMFHSNPRAATQKRIEQSRKAPGAQVDVQTGCASGKCARFTEGSEKGSN